MARSGMANIILEVRRKANAGTADTTVVGETYWSDDHIEDVLDQYVTIHKDVYLEGLAEIGSGGTAFYYDYLLPARWVEGTASNWSLLDTVGSAAPAYTFDDKAAMISFSSDTAGSAYYWTGRSYDVNRAVADIWESKAAHIAAGAVDWASDNHRVSQSKQIDNYMAMAKKFRNLAGPKVVRRVRVDERRY